MAMTSMSRSVVCVPVAASDVLPSRSAELVVLLRSVGIPNAAIKGAGDLCGLCEVHNNGVWHCRGVAESVSCLVLADGNKLHLEAVPPSTMEQVPHLQGQVEERSQKNKKGKVYGLFLSGFEPATPGQVSVMLEQLHCRGVYARCTLTWRQRIQESQAGASFQIQVIDSFQSPPSVRRRMRSKTRKADTEAAPHEAAGQLGYRSGSPSPSPVAESAAVLSEACG